MILFQYNSMGKVLELLNAEYFRMRPAMYVGSRRFSDIGCWLRGFQYCNDQFFKEPNDLDGFREWLHMNLDAPGNTDWVGMIQVVFGDEEEATEKCFECLDKFLKDLDEIGLDTILEKHANYEMKRYGMLSSSRFRKN